jgi:murein DD-endopeptidase MepM/ murein hydrolase activator NlpD
LNRRINNFTPSLKWKRVFLLSITVVLTAESGGDGRVTFIGWKGGYGLYIRIRHTHIYETGYGHLSRFAEGLKKGSRARQGDLIGYAGLSGLSIGADLDFSVIKGGRFIDPLRVESAPAIILSKRDRKRFNELVFQMEQVWQKDQTA